MLPAPNIKYKCPSCGNLIYRGGLISGNTFGAKIYSDGKTIAPMLPEFPKITKCKSCNHIFWIDKAEEMGTYRETFESILNPMDRAEFLEIDDYFKALENNMAETDSEESYIRQHIWWSYNDRVREGRELFAGDRDETLWAENLKRLLHLLEVSDSKYKTLIAEIYRNLGDFEKSIAILEAIEASHLDWIRERLIEECRQQNKLVVQLQ